VTTVQAGRRTTARTSAAPHDATIHLSSESAYDRLLDAVVEHVALHGISDLSLRSLAASIGTSHRMLIYHFGSKEGLLAAAVARVEADQRATLDALASAEELPTRQVLDLFWAGLVDPSMHDRERVFFEIVGQALLRRPGTEAVLDGLVEPWLEVVSAHGMRAGLDRDTARAQARLGMAVTRGLLLDLLATGDIDGVNAAWAMFADTFAPSDR
jgi:AcrR family transcriptional regulator